MFEPCSTFKYTKSVVRLNKYLRLSLEARVDQDKIVWTISEETRPGKDHYLIRRIVDEQFVYIDHFNHGHFADSEWNRRLIESRIHYFFAVLRGQATKEVGTLLWQLFRELYYPGETEDKYNKWVRTGFPELHQELVLHAQRMNRRLVQEILE